VVGVVAGELGAVMMAAPELWREPVPPMVEHPKEFCFRFAVETEDGGWEEEEEKYEGKA